MKLAQSIASAGILILLSSALVGAQSPAAPAPAAPPPAPASAPAPAAPMKSINKRYLLSHSSSVYRDPDTGSAVVAHLKRHSHVRVVGMTGDWLQVKLSSGKTGYIPTKAVE